MTDKENNKEGLNEEVLASKVSQLIPKVGEFSRMLAGTTVIYAVKDFKLAMGIHTMAKALGGVVKTNYQYMLAARDPTKIVKVIKVTVVKSARPLGTAA